MYAHWGLVKNTFTNGSHTKISFLFFSSVASGWWNYAEVHELYLSLCHFEFKAFSTKKGYFRRPVFASSIEAYLKYSAYYLRLCRSSWCFYSPFLHVCSFKIYFRILLMKRRTTNIKRWAFPLVVSRRAAFSNRTWRKIRINIFVGRGGCAK